MFPMHNEKDLPILAFETAEKIADGISVKPINFTAKNARPPFKATYFDVLPGCATPLDQHAVEECWIVLKGEGRLEHEGCEYRILPHDIFYFAAFKQHQVYNDSNETLTICSIYW